MNKMIKNLFATICVRSLPVSAIINEGVDIPKKVASIDHKTSVCNVSRSIHLYPSFTQGFVRAYEKFKTGIRPSPHYSAFGAIRGRRREEAILIQNIVRRRGHMGTL
eukprot:9177891-Karenia_brevis.AAC.1